jgi:hypothetical protein
MCSNSPNNDNTGTSKDEYYDQLTTEQALQAMVEENERLGLYDDYDKPTRNNKETQEIKLTFVK